MTKKNPAAVPRYFLDFSDAFKDENGDWCRWEDVDAALRNAPAELGRKGGRAKSDKKTAAVRENAKKGGWPKGKKRGPKSRGKGSR